MDLFIAAAPRAPLAVGDVLGALKRVGLREDPPALALRGIAMAQLGEHARDRISSGAPATDSALTTGCRARCVVAEAEVALAMRDLRGSSRPLSAASATLVAHSDRANARHARLIAVRRLLPLGRLDEAASALASVGAGPLDGDQASLLALLVDGAAWSTSALALALGASQRALVELEGMGRVHSIGRARAQRRLSPTLVGFTTNLLLPVALEVG